MKKIQFFFLMLLASLSLSAQKIGVVDTDYILNKMPQYKEAEARLNNQITGWQNEIQTLQSEYDKKKSTLENERVLLVGDQLKQREKEVDDLDKRIKAMLNNRFGTLGEVNNARSNLTKPFQDQIWNAIRTVSEKNSLGIILDKSNNISVIFLDKRYDYTDKVLDLLLKNAPARTGAAAENQQIRDDKMRIMQAEQGKGKAQQSQQSRRKK